MSNPDNRKISIIAPHLSSGGAKYLSALLTAMIKRKPYYDITIYEDIKLPYAIDLIKSDLLPLGVKIVKLRSLLEFKEKRKSRITFINNIINNYRRRRHHRRHLTLLKLQETDLLFCPWPYDYDCPKVNMPIVCITHDFNYMHHFGMNIYEFAHALNIKKQHENWLHKAAPIVSTNFIANELRKSFPLLAKEINVVPLSKLTDFKRLDDSKVDKILHELGINYDFVLTANNNTYHKNYNLLYAGYYYFKQKYPRIKLMYPDDNGHSHLVNYREGGTT